MFRRLMCYLEKSWQFSLLCDEVRDGRKYSVITAGEIFASVFTLFALRMRSLNILEQAMKNGAWFKQMFSSRNPSADTIAYSLSRFNLECLRRILSVIAHKTKRKKALKQISCGMGPYLVAAIDGHELWSGTKRCCPGCLTREIETVNGKQTQYYHKIVVLQLIGVTPALILDIEPVLREEGEIAAALRIIRRTRKYYPRFFDIISADALYLIKPFADAVREEGYDFVIVLKQENRELYRDVDGLMKITDCKRSKTEDGEIKLWDFENLESWTQLDYPVRVVCSREKTYKRVSGKDEVIENEWRWVTSLPSNTAPVELIWSCGHARWDIENRGFNELTQHWNMDHCFCHQPTAIIATLMILAMAFSLTTLFFGRNLKPEARKNKTRLFLASLFIADILGNQGCSLHSPP